MKYLAIPFLLLFSFTVFAEQQAEPYIGFSMGSVSYEPDDVPEFDMVIFSGMFGARVHENASIEVRFGSGTSDEVSANVNGDSAKFDVSLKRHYGAYLKLGVPVGESLYPYVLAGFTKVKADIDISGVIDGDSVSGSVTDSDSSRSFGAGAELKINDKVSGLVEYVDYLDESSYSIDGFNVGIKLAL